MRILIMLLCLSFASYAFAGNELTINDSVSVSVQQEPDIMRATVSVSVQENDFKTAVRSMERLTDVIKKHSGICTYKSYQVSPKYRYADSKRIDDGFAGALSSPCSFTQMQKYDSLVNDLNTLPARFAVTITPVRWALSEKAEKSAKTGIKTRLIEKIHSLVPVYSSATSKRCDIFEINFLKSTDFDVTMVRSSSALSISEPDKQDKTVTSTANFTLICK